eukprot:5465814-Prymnesium_polylepis.2
MESFSRSNSRTELESERSRDLTLALSSLISFDCRKPCFAYSLTDCSLSCGRESHANAPPSAHHRRAHTVSRTERYGVCRQSNAALHRRACCPSPCRY